MQYTFDLARFEEAARQNGVRYWIAHEVMTALGYEAWPSFQKVINKAMASCAALNVQIPEVFIPDTFVENGKDVSTFRLTRFACFLVKVSVMRCDVFARHGVPVFQHQHAKQVFVQRGIWNVTRKVDQMLLTKRCVSREDTGGFDEVFSVKNSWCTHSSS